ncbi:MAG TPA: hypothetical protein VI911_07115 [Patescibacteria group bacterium]|nr:hypothetical protein [Patescibacteria group bacterium]
MSKVSEKAQVVLKLSVSGRDLADLWEQLDANGRAAFFSRLGGHHITKQEWREILCSEGLSLDGRHIFRDLKAITQEIVGLLF